MLLQEIKTIFYQELKALYPKTEIDTFFYSVIEHYLGLERFILALRPDYTVTPVETTPLFQALAALKLEKPLQYILGIAHFMDLQLKVNTHVLIPRPETEELVQWIVDDVRREMLDIQGETLEVNPIKPERLRLLDVGTGSGCIAIALAKKLPEAEVYALDFSEKILKIARENAILNGVEVTFLKHDIRNPNPEFDLEFDLIVSNPPYVRACEKPQMKNNVKKYEPKTALFVPDETPLVFYEAIAQLAAIHLRDRGALYLEINQYLAKENQALLTAHNFSNLECRKDIFGNDRMIKGKMNLT